MALTQEEAIKKLAELVQNAEHALAKACEFVNEYPEYELSFSFHPAYGMGGYYDGGFDSENDSENGWHPSSLSC